VVSLAAALAIRLQAPVVEVNAYAGVDGDRAYVWDLGRRRAQAVALELMLDGVPAGVIRTSTNGPSGATPQGTPALDDGHVEIVVR
jgi:outer membrane protein OmpA-like peptidoglycan-associated protein